VNQLRRSLRKNEKETAEKRRGIDTARTDGEQKKEQSKKRPRSKTRTAQIGQTPFEGNEGKEEVRKARDGKYIERSGQEQKFLNKVGTAHTGVQEKNGTERRRDNKNKERRKRTKGKTGERMQERKREEVERTPQTSSIRERHFFYWTNHEDREDERTEQQIRRIL
jgi:hypothetical protein